MKRMNEIKKEIEVRFLIKDVASFAESLQRVGAICTHPRYLETNELFDTDEKRLQNNFEVLRLRRDWTQKITYKRALTFNIRDEIEFEISDADQARKMMEALGYKCYLLFEKYRSMYTWQSAQITIDETPLGIFVEIEDLSLEYIEEKADFLKLNWDAQVRKSYYKCFEIVQSIDGKLSEMTFEAFGGWMPSALELGLEYAD